MYVIKINDGWLGRAGLVFIKSHAVRMSLAEAEETAAALRDETTAAITVEGAD